MSNESELIALIAAIYEAGADFTLWPDALARIATAFGVPSAGMARQGKTPAECWGISSGVEPAAIKTYVEHYHSVNPIWQRVPNTPEGTVQADTMVIPRRELERTEFFNDYLVPQRIDGLLNSVVLVEESRQTVVTMHGRRQFDEEDIDFYRLITPHLQRAVQINLKSAQSHLNHAASKEALDLLNEGVLFVDANGSVMLANRRAESLFVADGGLRQRDGILRGNVHSETLALHALIAKCGQGGMILSSVGNLSLSRGAGRPPLSLMVAPVSHRPPDWLTGKRPVAIIFVNDPERTPKPASQQLTEQYGFTRAEAALAIEILDGDGIQAAADRLSISRATARTHLARVFDKTGVRRQSELVRLLMSMKLSI
jgi:DNA-binding CsgD family transcriptional regulator/PAS domain-containing protein